MELLKQLYKASSPSRHEHKMMTLIQNMLDESGIKHHSDIAGNIYATKGKSDTYPCVVAHTDEVHGPQWKGYKVMQHAGNIYGFNRRLRKYCGIGADDKNGIWICLKCLQKFETMKCVFFVSEEIGCIGSKMADMSFFDGCRFVIQCDRRGNNDLVTEYCGEKLCSDEFLRDASPQSNGYKETTGLITDVITLKTRGLKVSGVNISCGYYEPHTEHEFTNIADLYKCYNYVQYIVQHCTKTYTHRMVRPKLNRFEYRDVLPFFINHQQSIYDEH